jgi:hypothetical protein
MDDYRIIGIVPAGTVDALICGSTREDRSQGGQRRGLVSLLVKFMRVEVTREAASMDPSAIAATASSYSQFSGVLAGLAFAGLVVYLSRGDGKGANHGIAVWHVAATTFFSLFSLAAAAFLFANLDGMASIPSQANESSPYTDGALEVDVLTYGIILALAVLALLYSIVLMALQYVDTEKMGRYAYWALAIGGTIMVLRFLAESARDVLLVNCGNGSTVCPHMEFAGILSVPVIWLTLSLAVSLVVLFTVAARPEKKGGRPRGFAGWFYEKIVAPALLVFATTVFVVIGLSLYVETRKAGYEPSTGSIDTWYIGSILIVALFALMLGSVVAPRANVMVTETNDGHGRHERTERWSSFTGSAGSTWLKVALAAIALGLAIAIYVISGPIALWLLVPVLILTATFLASVKDKSNLFALAIRMFPFWRARETIEEE